MGDYELYVFVLHIVALYHRYFHKLKHHGLLSTLWYFYTCSNDPIDVFYNIPLLYVVLKSIDLKFQVETQNLKQSTSILLSPSNDSK